MAPTSYQAHHKGDDERQSSHSQSTDAALRPAGSETTVGDILADKGGAVFTVAPDMSIREVVTILRDNKIGVVLVMQGDTLAGILSERDLVTLMADTGEGALGVAVKDVMTVDPKTATPADPILAVLSRMSEGRFRHMPVIENDRLVGLVSIGDVVKHRLRNLEYEALRMKQMIVG